MTVSSAFPSFATSDSHESTHSPSLKQENAAHRCSTSRRSSMDVVMQDPLLDSQQQHTLSMLSSGSSQAFSSHHRPHEGSNRSSAAPIRDMDHLPDMTGTEVSASAGANTVASTATALSSHEPSPMIEVIARNLQSDIDTRPTFGESNSRRNSDSVRVGQLPSDFVDGAFGSTSPLDESDLASAGATLTSIDTPTALNAPGAHIGSASGTMPRHNPYMLTRDSTRSVMSDLASASVASLTSAGLGSIPAIGSMSIATPMTTSGRGSHTDLLALASASPVLVSATATGGVDMNSLEYVSVRFERTFSSSSVLLINNVSMSFYWSHADASSRRLP